MVFNSYTFVIFLGVVVLLHYSALSWRLKKLNLLVASYLFYAAWNPPFVALLWLSTVVDWFAARGIATTERTLIRRILVAISLTVNLGLLAFFKYGEFALDNFVWMLGRVGVEYVRPEWSIVLPVGISFYTFQTLSYTLDVYYKRSKPCSSFLDFALYVTFFPQLVAGPIVRATHFLPQCESPRRADRKRFAWGISFLVLGLFEKVVLADGIFSHVADTVYDATTHPNLMTAWCGTLAFSGQIFCDFAGYSTCAIGVAMCLGFALPDNFRFPYAAVGFTDFWRRWHISLSSWLRDYLYVPLGGNRSGRVRTYVNLMLTMLIGGLWHGASWTFVVWGGLHGSYLVIERLLKASVLAQSSIWKRSSVAFLLGLATFALVNFAWVFFRATSFDRAFVIAGAMLGWQASSAELTIGKMEMVRCLVPVIAILIAHWQLRNTTLEDWIGARPAWLWSLMMAGMLLAICTTPGDDRAFIYFQF